MKRTVGPLNITLAIPLNGLQPNAEVRADKSKVELPKFGKHVLSNEGGLFPFVSDQPWELEVIIAEIGVYNSLFWYRNPKSPKPESLRVAYDYDYDCEANIMMQDFPFFTERSCEAVAASIVAPHGLHFENALPKLRSIREFAAKSDF